MCGNVYKINSSSLQNQDHHSRQDHNHLRIHYPQIRLLLQTLILVLLTEFVHERQNQGSPRPSQSDKH